MPACSWGSGLREVGEAGRRLMDWEAKKKKQIGAERSHIQKSAEAHQAPSLFKTINCSSASGYCFPVGTWSHFFFLRYFQL